MSQSTQSISPLRQRMIDDMNMRKFGANTQKAYIRAVVQLTEFLKRRPDSASAEDLRLFQLHLVETGTSTSTVNATISGLRFFFEVTLSRPEAMVKMSQLHRPRRLPEILSAEEVTRLIEAASSSPKYQCALSIAYGAGLRASEVTHLKVGDIDSQRMAIRVEQGKGK